MTYILKLRRLQQSGNREVGWKTAYFCPGTAKVAGATAFQDQQQKVHNCSNDSVWHEDTQPRAYRFHSMEQVLQNFDAETLDRLGIIIEQVEA